MTVPPKPEICPLCGAVIKPDTGCYDRENEAARLVHLVCWLKRHSKPYLDAGNLEVEVTAESE